MVPKECDSSRITCSLVTRVHCRVITLKISIVNRKRAGKVMPSGGGGALPFPRGFFIFF